MLHHDEYENWPFLTKEEFELACAYFDQSYVKASLGEMRRKFKLYQRRTLTTGITYLEILRVIQLPGEDEDLNLALENLGRNFEPESDVSMDTTAEDTDQEALRSNPVTVVHDQESNGPPNYSLYSHQPYVTYEIHLHPTYSVPVLWFTLHDLPMDEPTFDIEAVYRYLVPPEYKDQLRALGVIGGISAAPHPITDVPAFFIHPCQTKEAMEGFDCLVADYITIWLGLVGGCVGLWVPSEMIQRDI